MRDPTSTGRTRRAAARSASSLEYAYSFLATARLVLQARRRAAGSTCMQACNPPDIFWPIARWLRRRDGTAVRLRPPRPVPGAVRLALPRRRRGCPHRGCCSSSARPSAPRTTSSPPTSPTPRSPSRRGGKAADDVTRRPHRARTRERLRRRRAGRPSCAAAARTWSPTSASWARRTASTSRCGAAGHRRARARPRRHRVHVHGRRATATTTCVALRDELGLTDHVELPGRVPDELVAEVLSTADVGLSPDPKNPLNDVSTMNKTMEYMAFGLPVVAFDLRETRVSAGDAAVYVPAQRRRRRTPRPSSTSSTTRARRAEMGRLGRAPGRGRAGLGAPARGLPRASSTSWSGTVPDRGAASRTRGPDDVRGRRGVPAARRRRARRDHDRADRAPRAGRRRRCVEPSTATTAVAPRPPPAVDHRPVDRGRPAVRQGRPDAHLQRRALQLPRAARRAGGAGRPVRAPAPTPRWCSRPGAPGVRRAARGSAACSPSRSSTSAPATLTLARDPFGIKPLYVMPRGDGVLFASELKALVAARRARARRSTRGALVASTLYYWVPEEHCAVRGRRRSCPPGTWAECRPDGTLRPRRVLGHRGRGRRARPRAAAPPTCAAVIEESVAAHLVADVPVSRLPVSGGLDSSLVTVLAAPARPGDRRLHDRFRPEDQRLEAMPDDARYARKIAAQLGIGCTRSRSRPDVVDMLPRMVDILDEPIGDPAAINTVLMCEAAREAGVKVLLSGHGRRRAVRRLPQAPRLPARGRATSRLPAALRPAVDRAAVRPAAGRRRRPRACATVRWAKRFLTFAELPEEAAFRRSYTLYDADELAALLDPDLAGHVDHVVDEHARRLRRQRARRPREPDVPDRLAAVPARPQPGLHRPGEHGRLHRGARAVRRPRGGPRRRSRSRAARRSAAGRRRWRCKRGGRGRGCPSEIVDRPEGLFGAPLRAWVTQRPRRS